MLDIMLKEPNTNLKPDGLRPSKTIRATVSSLYYETVVKKIYHLNIYVAVILDWYKRDPYLLVLYNNI